MKSIAIFLLMMILPIQVLTMGVTVAKPTAPQPGEGNCSPQIKEVRPGKMNTLRNGDGTKCGWKLKPNRHKNESFLKFTISGAELYKFCNDAGELKINGEIACAGVNKDSNSTYCQVYYAMHCESAAKESTCQNKTEIASFPVFVQYNSSKATGTSEFAITYEFEECLTVKTTSPSEETDRNGEHKEKTAGLVTLGGGNLDEKLETTPENVDQDDERTTPPDMRTIIPLAVALLAVAILLAVIFSILRRRRRRPLKDENQNIAMTEHRGSSNPPSDQLLLGTTQNQIYSHHYSVINDAGETDTRNLQSSTEVSSNGAESQSDDRGYCTIAETIDAENRSGQAEARSVTGRQEFQYAAVNTTADGQKETVRYKKSLVNNELYEYHK